MTCASGVLRFTHMPTPIPHRGVNLFYLIIAILFGLANLFAYAVWWPRDAQQPVAVVDAPTVITDHPEEQILAIQTTAGAGTILPTAQSSSTVLALIKDDATSITPAKPVVENTTGGAVSIPKNTASTDRLSPTTPGGLIVRSSAYNQVVISWTPSTDNRGVAGYAIYENSKLIGTTIKTLQGFIHLTPSTNYTFGVAAFDSAGNSSNINNILVATPEKPLAPVATTPPPTPSPVAEITPDPSPLPPAPPAPPNLCGNGTQDRGEECDDGNTSDNDMCTNQCKAARCTDGIVNYVLEQCDDGNEVANDYCDNQCHNHVPVLPTPIVAPDPTPAPTPAPTPPPVGSFALTTTVTGSGSISSSPSGITCGTTCSANFTSGTVVTLTRTANTGASFTSWGGACTGSGTTCTVTMSPAKSVTATFTTAAATTYTLNVTSAGVYSPTSLSLRTGDKVRIVYTPPYGAEVITVFTPTPPTQTTVDSSVHSRTVTFSTAGTWTFTAKDHAGSNTGTITVQ